MSTPFGSINIYFHIDSMDEIDEYIEVLNEHLAPALEEIKYEWLGEGYDLNNTYDISYTGDTHKLAQARVICKNVLAKIKRAKLLENDMRFSGSIIS